MSELGIEKTDKMRKKIWTLLIGTVLTLGALVLYAANSDEPRAPVAINRDKSDLDRTGANGVITSYADVLEQVTPAVVSITVERKQVFSPRSQRQYRSQQEFYEDFLRRFYGLPMPEREEPEEPEDSIERFIPEGSGSGFIVSADGYILTNNHVVRAGRWADDSFDNKRVKVNLIDGREFEAEIIGTDPQTDLAVLKVDADKLPAVTFGDSDKLRVGDITFAIGNPLSIGLTVSQGIVSANNRTDLGIIDRGLYQSGADLRSAPAIESFIQTDAAINMGNSGGALVDAQGRVIGINTAISSIGGGSIGIGFAIPSNVAERVLQELVTGGSVRRGFIGVGLAEVTPGMAKSYELESAKGVLIDSVQPGLPGERAGLKRGDIVLSVDGERVDGVRDMIYLISIRPPGSTVTLEVFRWGERLDIAVVLGERSKLIAEGGYLDPEEASPDGVDSGESSSARANELVAGVTVRPLNDDLRQELGLDDSMTALYVVSVEPNDKLETTLQRGMVILEINNKRVSTLKEARRALKTNGRNVLYVMVEGRETYQWLIAE